MSLPNIILIVLDTTRRDAVGTYNKDISSPYLSEFSKDAVVYKNAISTASWTIPSHVSFLTGLYPVEHKINRVTLLDNVITDMRNVRERYLPKRLQKIGYKTIGISANNIVSPEFGFNYGFDVFFNYDWKANMIPDDLKEEILKLGQERSVVIKNLLKRGKFGTLINMLRLVLLNNRYKRIINYPKIKGADMVYRAVKQVQPSDPFFMYINLMEMHEPYGKFSDLNKKFHSIEDSFKLDRFLRNERLPDRVREWIKQEYYGQMNILDSYFGKIIVELKEKGLYDNSLIVVLSDHGQTLGENEWLYHGHFLYDELVEVPLMIKYPEKEPDYKNARVNSGYQSLTDVYNVLISYAEGKKMQLSDREYVFAETYSNETAMWWERFDFKKYNMSERDKLQLFASKKAIFCDGYKLVLEGNKGTIIEFSHNGKSVKPESHNKQFKNLLEQLEFFIGNDRFNIPMTGVEGLDSNN